MRNLKVRMFNNKGQELGTVFDLNDLRKNYPTKQFNFESLWKAAKDNTTRAKGDVDGIESPMWIYADGRAGVMYNENERFYLIFSASPRDDELESVFYDYCSE